MDDNRFVRDLNRELPPLDAIPDGIRRFRPFRAIKLSHDRQLNPHPCLCKFGIGNSHFVKADHVGFSIGARSGTLPVRSFEIYCSRRFALSSQKPLDEFAWRQVATFAVW
jgi:hypothetical protein